MDCYGGWIDLDVGGKIIYMMDVGTDYKDGDYGEVTCEEVSTGQSVTVFKGTVEECRDYIKSLFKRDAAAWYMEQQL